MSEKIQQVAEAMRLRAIERGHPIHPALLHHLAAAAIEAMREPTEAMLQAPAMRRWAWKDDEGVTAGDIADAWNAMIDEALK